MDSAQNAAGQAKGQVEEKGNQMMDTANNAVKSATDSSQQAGQQMKAEAQGAADAVKSTVGANK